MMAGIMKWARQPREYQGLQIQPEIRAGSPGMFAWEILPGGEPGLGLRWERRGRALFGKLLILHAPLPALPEGAGRSAFRDADVNPGRPPRALAVSVAAHILFLITPLPELLTRPPAHQPQFTTVRVEYDLRWTGTSPVLPPISPTPARDRSGPGGAENEPLPPPGALSASAQTIVSNPPQPNHPTQTLLQQFGIERARVSAPDVRLPNMVIPPSADAAPTPEVNLNRLKVPDAPFDLTGPPRSPVLPRPKSRAQLALESTKLENLHARLTLPATQGGEGSSAAPEVNAPVGSPRSGDLATPGVVALSANPGPAGPVLRLPETNLRARFAVGPNAGAGSPGGVAGGVPGGRGGSGGGPGGGGLAAPDIFVEPAGPVPPGPVIVGQQRAPLVPAPPPKPEPTSPASPAGDQNRGQAGGTQAQAEKPGSAGSQKSAEQRARELMEAVQAGARSPRPVRTTYAFISNLTSQSSTWMVRYAEHQHSIGDGTNGANGPARVAQEGAVRLPGITPPQVVKKVDPCYPANPLAERVDGTVILYGVIRQDGIVEDVVLVEGIHPAIDKKAELAFAQSVFEPARKKGQPIPVEVLIEIPFRMARCL